LRGTRASHAAPIAASSAVVEAIALEQVRRLRHAAALEYIGVRRLSVDGADHRTSADELSPTADKPTDDRDAAELETEQDEWKCRDHAYCCCKAAASSGTNRDLEHVVATLTEQTIRVLNLIEPEGVRDEWKWIEAPPTHSRQQSPHALLTSRA
jgi:hypothetical protein